AGLCNTITTAIAVALPNITVSIDNGGVPFFAAPGGFSMPAGASVTLTYIVTYNPLCETDPNVDDITNTLVVSYPGSIAVLSADSFMQENTKCQLSVCKMNHADTN